jgi:hypothetical protein
MPTLPLTIDGVPATFDVEVPAGTQLTAAGDRVRTALEGAYQAGKSMALAIARDVARSARALPAEDRPAGLQVQLGLRFTAAGDAVVVSAASEASLTLTFTYALDGVAAT